VRNKFYVDELYGRALVLPAKRAASFSAEVVDAKVFDGVINGTAWLVARFSEGFRRVQSGYVRNYALVFLAGVVILFSVLVVSVGLTA
jgi:NADH-quinone oxidoreductase subunit L